MTLRQQRLLLIGFGLVLAGMIGWLISLSLGGGSVPATEIESVPRAGISDRTVAVVRLDLERLDVGTWRSLLEGAGSVDGGGNGLAVSVKAWDRFRAGLLESGTSVLLLPIGDPSDFAVNAGVYLGGRTGRDRREVESGVTRAAGGGWMGWATLVGEANDLGSGWYYWGVNGSGISPNRDIAKAKRLEALLKTSGPAIASLVILGNGPNPEANPLQAHNRSNSRLHRQYGTLSAASKNLDAWILQLRSDQSGELQFVGSASFRTSEAAQAFVAEWKTLTGDLKSLTGVVSANPSPLESFAVAAMELLMRLPLRANGNVVELGIELPR